MRALLSYHYYKNTDLEKLAAALSASNTPVDIMADSGAFSAFTLGEVIDINKYAEWVRYWSPLFTAYANLDVIGDVQATYENQLELESMGLNPLPIFHTGEPWHYLDTYIEKYPYIMLGGMVPYSLQKQLLMPWLIQCFKRADKKSLFHGLGLTSWYALSSLPWYSVDSSSWAAGFRYGRVPIFDERTGRMTHIKIGQKQEWKNNAVAVRALGFNPAVYADRPRVKRTDLCQIGAASYKAAERYLRKRHGSINFKDHTGLNVYLVDGSIPNLVDGASGLNIYLSTSDPDNYKEAEGLRIYITPGGNAKDLERLTNTYVERED